MNKTRVWTLGMFVIVALLAFSCSSKKGAEGPESSIGTAESGGGASGRGGLGDLGKLDGSNLMAIHFDFDSAELSSEASQILQNNADYMKKHPKATIVIEGHCDERGTNEYNLALGERRAGAAKRYMVSLGVAASRLKTKSYGEERPLVQGSGEDAWYQNRRCEFVQK